MSTPPLSRRDALGRLATATLLGTSASTLLSACSDGQTAEERAAAAAAAPIEPTVVDAATCAGYGDLSERALRSRASLNYVDATAVPERYCVNCRYKKAYAADSNCLGCTLFAGPVSPGGWCQTWAPLR